MFFFHCFFPSITNRMQTDGMQQHHRLTSQNLQKFTSQNLEKKKIPKIRRRPRPGRSPPPPRRHAPPPHRHAPPTLPPRPSAAATRGRQSSRACVQLLCRPTMPLPRCHTPPPRPQGAARAAAAPCEGEESIRKGEGRRRGEENKDKGRGREG